MKQFVLPKKFEDRGRGVPFFYNDQYLSNGKFLIKKDIVKDSYKHCMPTTINMPDLNRVVPTELPPKRYIKTYRLLDHEAFFVRVFICIETGEEAGFCEDFVSHFEINELFGDCSTNVFCTETMSFIVMPCRHVGLKQDGAV